MRPDSEAHIYLDYNATAPLLPVARARMLAALEAYPGNPSSPHGPGQAARNALEEARAGLAALLGVGRREVLFTSGGSEGNNLLLRWPAWGGQSTHVITTPIEHPSVLESAAWLRGQGVEFDYLPVNADGVVAVEAVDNLLRPETRLVSLMAANNETGVLQPVAELVRRVRARPGGDQVVLHCDAVQAFGRVPFLPHELGLDSVTIAGHKLGAPKGIGAVVIREGRAVTPLILGGRQERGRRAGTESVALAQAFLAAAEWAAEHREQEAERLAALRDRLTGRLAKVDGFFQNGAQAGRLPNTVNLGFEGVSAQSLLVALDLRGVAVSTGSACSSGAVEPSHVLTAMGQPPARVEGALRISMGHATTTEQVDACAEIMAGEVARLRATQRQASA